METFNSIILYFFSPLPGSNFLYYVPIGILIVLLLSGSIFLSVKTKKGKEDKAFRKTFRSFPGKLQLLSFLLALYLLFRYYYVPFFSMRFLLLVLLFSTAFVLYLLLKAYRQVYPVEKEKRMVRNEKNTYLPSKHKKRNK